MQHRKMWELSLSDFCTTSTASMRHYPTIPEIFHVYMPINASDFSGATAACKSLPSPDIRRPATANHSTIIHSGNVTSKIVTIWTPQIFHDFDLQDCHDFDLLVCQKYWPPSFAMILSPQLCHGNLCLESLRFKYRSELDSRCNHESFRWQQRKLWPFSHHSWCTIAMFPAGCFAATSFSKTSPSVTWASAS